MEATTPIAEFDNEFHNQGLAWRYAAQRSACRQQPDGGSLAVAANTVVLGSVLGEFGQYPARP